MYPTTSNDIPVILTKKNDDVISERFLSENDAKTYANTLMISFDQNHDKVLTKTEFIEGCLNDSTLARFTNPFNL